MRPRCRMSSERARTKVGESKLSLSRTRVNSAIDEAVLVVRDTDLNKLSDSDACDFKPCMSEAGMDGV